VPRFNFKVLPWWRTAFNSDSKNMHSSFNICANIFSASSSAFKSMLMMSLLFNSLGSDLGTLLGVTVDVTTVFVAAGELILFTGVDVCEMETPLALLLSILAGTAWCNDCCVDCEVILFIGSTGVKVAWPPKRFRGCVFERFNPCDISTLGWTLKGKAVFVELVTLINCGFTKLDI
jgi:hypothetical protein